MSRTILFLFFSAVLLSLSLAHAQNKELLKPDRPLGLTAEQQSNDEADVAITRKIRRALVKDSRLSLYAQNVKIITVDGHVVLKGPVRNSKEKLKVERIAEQLAGKDLVTSELDLGR